MKHINTQSISKSICLRYDLSIYFDRTLSSSAVIPPSLLYPRPSSSNWIWLDRQAFCRLGYFPTFMSAIITLKKTLKYCWINVYHMRMRTFRYLGWNQNKGTYPRSFMSPFFWASVMASCCLSCFSSSDSAWLRLGRVEAAADAAATSSGSKVALKNIVHTGWSQWMKNDCKLWDNL